MRWTLKTLRDLMTLRKKTALIILGHILFLAGCTSTPKIVATPSRTDNLCQIFAQNPSWLQDAYAAQNRWGTSIATKMAIIWYESRFRADARPIKSSSFFGTEYASSAYGYSQALDGTWDWYKKETGRDNADRTNFSDAIDFVGWYMAKSHKMIGLSLDDAYNQYLAYHEGQRGFTTKSYIGKAWLLNIAKKVDERSQQYQTQLNSCSLGS